VNVLSRRIGSVVAAAAVAFGLAAVVAPAASAAPAVPAVAAPAAVTAAAAWSPRWCKPAHTGRSWRWEEGRRGGHWDHREWNRRTQRWEWRHQWRDDRYCAPRRFDGPPRGSDGPPANPRGPERGRS
jgi:hypothetical protein